MKDKKLNLNLNNQPMTGLEFLQIGLMLFKWAGFIDWSWWKVFLPTWVFLGIASIVIIVLKLKRYL